MDKVTGCNRIVMLCLTMSLRTRCASSLLVVLRASGVRHPGREGHHAYKNPKYAPFKTLFLFTNPRDVVRAVKGGIPFKSVNLGGMTYKDGDTLISQAVAVNKDDAAAIKELVDMGIEVEIRKLANEPKKDAIEALKAKGLL